ncbi:MAG: transcription termination factor Rho [Lachnospiraceae bacterium]|nr:transcription termination factor Rho [Lachnospiraceae bacterium]
MREKLKSFTLTQLRDIAKSAGLKGVTGLKKEELIERLVQLDEKMQAEKASKADLNADKPAGNSESAENKPAAKTESPEKKSAAKTESPEDKPAEKSEDQEKKASDKRGRAPRKRKPEDASGEKNDAGSPEKQSDQGERRQADARKNDQARGERRQPENRRQDQARGERQQGEGQKSEQARSERQQGEGQKQDQARGERTPNDGQKPDAQRTQRQDNAYVPQEGDEPAYGILEVMPEGYGFIRCDNYLPGESDVYVSPAQIRKFGLRTGDVLDGVKKAKSATEKFSPLIFLNTVNGYSLQDAMRRVAFENMTPIFPNQRIRMETSDEKNIAMRVMDLVSPVGKGQRGMIVSPPKAGKTTLLKSVAQSILFHNPDTHIIILLIDERPEEVTDMKEAIKGKNVEVIYSTFDEMPEHHARVSEMVIERARRLVEHKEDVVILLDSITRLARAYNQVIPPSGRTLSGGLDPAALHMPKRFFGAARNMREGGSLTILATALVETGSKMDDVVYEEFKGTGNMEMILDRKLSEKRIFPAVDLAKSGTRREDLLLSREELRAMEIARRALNGLKSDDAADRLLEEFKNTRSNAELVRNINVRNHV